MHNSFGRIAAKRNRKPQELATNRPRPWRANTTALLPKQRDPARFGCHVTSRRVTAKRQAMTLMQRFLRDDSGAVLAEWVLAVTVVVTQSMVALTALRDETNLADNSAIAASGT